MPTRRQTSQRPFTAWSALAILFLAATPVASSRADDGMAFFEREVRPVLVARCYECHASTSKKVRGGLTLDTREGWVRGGDQGPAVVAGDPGNSLLITAVSYTDDDMKMPPRGKLPDREIAALTRWVAMGAPDPRTAPAATGPVAKPTVRADKDFWAFRPPADPPLPQVGHPGWVSTPVDRFILARLENEGIAPAPPADARTLIRRATFDLTGLPPTLEEVEAFVADRRPDAYERLIERLLASPRHGEKWGRHWLDVARYSDSNGLDENVAHGNAWRYRDYVVSAFNRDLPFDRFLREQLAGDLLGPDDAPDRDARVIATGFLALGPKVLAEVDESKMEMDIVDEQIDTTGRAFLGLTLGCARCHDHKFDPFPTTDYYGLAGVFKSTRTMEHFKKVARWYENPVGSPAERAKYAEHAAKVAAAKEAVATAVRQADEAVKDRVPANSAPTAREEFYPPETRTALARLRAEVAKLEKAAPELPTAMGVAEGPVVADVRVHIRGSAQALGDLAPRHVPAVLAGPTPPSFSTASSGRLELANWMTDPRHPLTARVMVNRVWRWHFGRGLVATPDNFGALGARPSHPELLDWLAHQFVAGGWSIKNLHRLIMLSSAYRSSGAYNEAAARKDPENRLLWRFAPRRLEAEEVRDALLAVGSGFDPAMEGSLLTVKNRAYFFDHTSKDATKYESRRRSLYLPVVRNHVYDVFELFDFADPGVPNGDRATTTVAPQALFLMNGEFVERAADELAAATEGPGSDADRVARLYARAYGRPARDAEVARALAFLDGFTRVGSRERGWQTLAQAVLASNEFLYVE